MVDRYDVRADMDLHPQGDYVEYADYDMLQDERNSLEEQVVELENKIDELEKRIEELEQAND